MVKPLPNAPVHNWRLYLVEHDLRDNTFLPREWRSNLVIVDEVGDRIGHHYASGREVKYSGEQLRGERRKEILNHINNNKQEDGYVVLYRSAFTEAEQVMIEGASVSPE